MKFRNPFRTKVFIIATVKRNYIIKVPFFKKSTIREEKIKIRGYEVTSIIIDETASIKKGEEE